MSQKEMTRIEGAKELLQDLQESFLNDKPLIVEANDFNLVAWLIRQVEQQQKEIEEITDKNHCLLNKVIRFELALKQISNRREPNSLNEDSSYEFNLIQDISQKALEGTKCQR